jgi:FixJ family two-component response regulator
MISGLANAAIRQRAAVAGVRLFLEKPLRQDLLIDTVKRVWRECAVTANDALASRAVGASVSSQIK